MNIKVITLAIILVSISLVLNQVCAETYRNTITNETYSFYGNYSVSDYNRLVDYCFDHSEQVLAGKNVIQDLANAGLIPRWFDNKSCLNVQDEIEDSRAFERMLIQHRTNLLKLP
jgi:hypothetical protein